jgi:XTP/dITP diphosphohydrolase
MTGMAEVLFATGNPHKVLEANLTLSRFGIRAVAASCKKLEIQSDSLKEIAEYAASIAAESLEAPVVVEDSGLFIETLAGFPGPYTAYALNTIGCGGVLKLLSGLSARRAYFECVVAFCRPGSKPTTFAGRAHGEIPHQPAGTAGFGFDPIFLPFAQERTFAQMSAEEKEGLSHRGIAFVHFAEWYNRTEMAKLK